MTQTLPERPAISVSELQRAWAAVQAGDFRTNTTTIRQAGKTLRPRPACSGENNTWTPDADEVVLPILGCGGSTGATILAIAIATVAGKTARVVECASVTSSGLAAASTAELGAYESTWSRGSREGVLLERVSDVLTTADEIPHPSTPDRPIELTVLDIGWELGQVLTTPGWIGGIVRTSEHLVLTTTATVPGIRRLEGALDLLDRNGICAAVLGPRRKKWPKSVEYAAGQASRGLDRDELLFEIPEDHTVALNGLTGAPLSTPLLTAAHQLVRCLLNAPAKGTPQ